MLTISFFVCIIGGFVPVGSILSIQRSFTFMPCFFIGYYANRYRWLDIVRRINPLWLVLLSIGLFIILESFHIDFYGRTPYHTPIDALKRLFFICSSLVISCAFLRICPTWYSMAQEGRDVLFYYIYHSFMLLAVSAIVIASPIHINGLTVIGVALIVMLFLYSIKRMPVVGNLFKKML